MEDLIQEGNIGLMMAVEKMENADSLAAFQAQLMNQVNQSMQDVLKEQKDIRDMGKGIAQRVNHLNEAIHQVIERIRDTCITFIEVDTCCTPFYIQLKVVTFHQLLTLLT